MRRPRPAGSEMNPSGLFCLPLFLQMIRRRNKQRANVYHFVVIMSNAFFEWRIAQSKMLLVR